MSIKAITFEPVAVYRKPAYGKPGYGFRLSNLDELNPVYFETDNLVVTSSASSPLPQQASVTFDGSKDVWMSSGVLGRIVLVDFSPSSLTYDNPVGVQIALNALGLATAAGQVAQETAIPNNIATTGTPLLHGYKNVYDDSSIALTAGGSAASGILALSSPGYGVFVAGNCNGSSITPFIQATVRFYDALGTTVIARSDWILPCNAAGTLSVFGQGPARGPFMQITLTNLDGSNAMTASMLIVNATHHIARDDWRSINGTAPPSYVNAPGANPTQNILLNSNTGTASADEVSYLLNLYAGQAFLSYSLTPTISASTAQLFLSDYTNTAPLYQSPIATVAAPIVAVNLPITLPRKPVQFIVQGSASAIGIDATLTCMEYAS